MSSDFEYRFYISNNSVDINVLGQCHHKEKKILVFLGNIYKSIIINSCHNLDTVFFNSFIIDDCINAISNTIIHESLHKVIMETIQIKDLSEFSFPSFTQEVMVKKMMGEEVIVTNLFNYLSTDFKKYIEIYAKQVKKLTSFNNSLTFTVTALMVFNLFIQLTNILNLKYAWILYMFIVGFYIYATTRYYFQK